MSTKISGMNYPLTIRGMNHQVLIMVVPTVSKSSFPAFFWAIGSPVRQSLLAFVFFERSNRGFLLNIYCLNTWIFYGWYSNSVCKHPLLLDKPPLLLLPIPMSLRLQRVASGWEELTHSVWCFSGGCDQVSNGILIYLDEIFWCDFDGSWMGLVNGNFIVCSLILMMFDVHRCQPWFTR